MHEAAGFHVFFLKLACQKLSRWEVGGRGVVSTRYKRAIDMYFHGNDMDTYHEWVWVDCGYESAVSTPFLIIRLPLDGFWYWVLYSLL